MSESMIMRFSTLPTLVIIFITTFAVVVSSVPLVYALVSLFEAKYTNTVFVMSITAPLLMVPPTIAILIKLSRHLKHFKDELENEIQKNKKKDILLFEQARFVLMGEMMANISHQWKQPLNTIGLCVVNARVSDGDTIEKNFDIIEDNISYLASTIDDFMSFFDNKTYSELRDLEDILKEIRSIIQVQIKNENIECIIRVDRDYGELAMASSISQVLLNLLSNAKDAFDDNADDNKKIILKFIPRKDGVEIVCCDNGSGIKSEIKDKIFDPYFTTKNKTQGTGIGLYMSKQIIQKVFSGDISLKLNPTCFHINIPYTGECMLKKSLR